MVSAIAVIEVPNGAWPTVANDLLALLKVADPSEALKVMSTNLECHMKLIGHALLLKKIDQCAKSSRFHH